MCNELFKIYQIIVERNYSVITRFTLKKLRQTVINRAIGHQYKSVNNYILVRIERDRWTIMYTNSQTRQHQQD